GVGDEEVVVGEGVVVISSSLDMLTNSYLGGIMVSLIFLERLYEEALVEFMLEWCEEDEDDDRNEEVDVVFDGAFGGVGDEEVVVGEGVVVISSSLDMLTNSCLGGIMNGVRKMKMMIEMRRVTYLIREKGSKWKSMRVKFLDSKSGLEKCRRFRWV
nr:hypothetical protein [Tanacetum cinerariifolium]